MAFRVGGSERRDLFDDEFCTFEQERLSAGSTHLSRPWNNTVVLRTR